MTTSPNPASVPARLAAREFGFVARGFLVPAEEFLASDSIRLTKCLVLDIAMPERCPDPISSARRYPLRRYTIPIVFITAHSRRHFRPPTLCFNRSAVECLLSYPFSETALLEAINTALRAN